MLTKIGGRWFIELCTTQKRIVRIAVEDISVLNDEGPTCGIVTRTGFVAAISDTADNVWRLLESMGDSGNQPLNG